MSKEKIIADAELALNASLQKYVNENPDATKEELLAYITGWQAAQEYALTLLPKFLL